MAGGDEGGREEDAVGVEGVSWRGCGDGAARAVAAPVTARVVTVAEGGVMLGKVAADVCGAEGLWRFFAGRAAVEDVLWDGSGGGTRAVSEEDSGGMVEPALENGWCSETESGAWWEVRELAA